MVAALRWRLQGIGALDLTPSVRPEPVTVIEPDPEDGPVLVLIRYRVDPGRTEEFATAMRAMRRVRRRDGAYRWGVFEDVADPGCFVETYVVRSWAEHLRQHERFTAEDLAVRDRVRSFHIGEDPPVVSHHPPRRRHHPAPLGPLDPLARRAGPGGRGSASGCPDTGTLEA